MRRPMSDSTRRSRIAHAMQRRLPGPVRLVQLAERRLGRHVLAAVPLTATRGALGDLLATGPRTRHLLALTDHHLFVLAMAPGLLAPRVGGVLEHFERSGVVVHAHRHALTGGQTLELSWPEHAAFIVGRIPNGDGADYLLAHLAADELQDLWED